MRKEFEDNVPAIVLPEHPYHNYNHSRALSRVDDRRRLLARAIRSTTKRPKQKYDKNGGYVISRSDVKPPITIDHLPKEWK